MDEATKRLWDVLFGAAGLGAAALAFVHTIHTWRDGQRWKRAEQLDRLIERFEIDAKLCLAATVIDWTYRNTKFDGQLLKFTNDDVVLALRTPKQFGDDLPVFSPTQAALRDAYDALLTFFARLDIALESALIDSKPTGKYFKYWLARFVLMDKHPPVPDPLLKGKNPNQLVHDYIVEYGDVVALDRLCRLWGVVLKSESSKPAVSSGDGPFQ